MSSKFFGIVNHQSLLEVSCAELDGDVQEKHDVGETVTREPQRRRAWLKLRETLSND
jgi:hypothetical protein